MQSRPGSRLGRRAWLLTLILTAAVALLLAGGYLLGRHFLQGQDRPYRALSGWLLIGAAVVQLRVAWLVDQRNSATASRLSRFRSPYWRWGLIGPVICYLAVLVLGPPRDAHYVFLASVSLWYTAMLVPLAVSRPPTWSLGRLPRLLGNSVFVVAMLGVAAELGLRVVAALRGERLEINYVTRQHILPPGREYRGRRVNRLGYWDDEFRGPRRPGGFRIAVLGDEMALSGSATTNFLARLERRLPGVEVCNFGVARTGPREYAATLTRDVLPYQPDLVLTLVSVGDDVTGRLRLPGRFDWQGLYLYQFFRPRSQPLAVRHALPSSPQRGREPYLRAAGERLAVCRSPLDDPMRRRWRDTFSHLDELAAACRARNIPTTLAIAPSEVQLDIRLRSTLCRRLGCATTEVACDLPQRMLAEYARDRSIPVIDMLPHFQRSSDPLYGQNDHRFNDRGNQLAASVIGDWLQRRYATRVAQAAAGSRLR